MIKIFKNKKETGDEIISLLKKEKLSSAIKVMRALEAKSRKNLSEAQPKPVWQVPTEKERENEIRIGISLSSIVATRKKIEELALVNQQIASWSEQALKKNEKIKKAKALGQEPSAEKNEEALSNLSNKLQEAEKRREELEKALPEIIKKTDFSGCKK